MAMKAVFIAKRKAREARDRQMQVEASKAGFAFRLQIGVNRGVGLLNVEDFSKSDPFCVLWVGKERKRTKMIANDLNPIWNEKYDIMLKTPEDVVSFAVFDMEGIGEPVEMGGFQLHIDNLLDQDNKWFTRKLRLEARPELDCGDLEFEIHYSTLPVVGTEHQAVLKKYPRRPGNDICNRWEEEGKCKSYDNNAKCCFDHPPHDQIPYIRAQAARKFASRQFGAGLTKVKTASMIKALTAGAPKKVIKVRSRLHTAASTGDMELLSGQLQLEDIEVDDCDPDNGQSALHMACREGHLECAQMLMLFEPNVDLEDTKGWTALHRTAAAGHVELVELLIESKAKLSVNDPEDGTPLHLACQYGHGEITALLADASADVCAQDCRGWTALHWAAHNGTLSCALALIENSAASPNIDALDSMLQTPLHIACLRGSATVVQLLVESGAGIHEASGDMGTQPVHRAAMGGHSNIVEALIQGGADVNAVDEAGMMPVHWASIQGHPEVVKTLVVHGADLFHKCLSGERAIALAEVKGFNNTAAVLEKAMGNDALIHVEVTTPTANSVWEWKDGKDLIWKSSGYSSYCRIELYKGDESVLMIATKAANDGSFWWEVPVLTSPGDDYKIKVTSLVNSSTTGYSPDFSIKERTEKALEELEERRLKKAITAKVTNFRSDYIGKGLAFDASLLILCLSRPSLGVGKGVVEKILELGKLSEEVIIGDQEMTEEDFVWLMGKCLKGLHTFEKSLHRRLPRIGAKMEEQAKSFVERKQILRDLFNKIDKNGEGTIDNEEMQQFFGITGGANRTLNYTQAQRELMTEEDKELLLTHDNFTSSMDASGDGELQFSEFLRFFTQHHPDGTPQELLHSLQDLGYFRPTGGSEARASLDLGSLKQDPREALTERFESLDFDRMGCVSIQGAQELETEFGIPNQALSSTAGTWENERLPLDEMFRILEGVGFLESDAPVATEQPKPEEAAPAVSEAEATDDAEATAPEAAEDTSVPAVATEPLEATDGKSQSKASPRARIQAAQEASP